MYACVQNSDVKITASQRKTIPMLICHQAIYMRVCMCVRVCELSYTIRCY